MRFRHAVPVLLSIVCLAPALAQDVSYKSTSLGPGLYMLEGVGGFGGGNMGLLTGDDGTFLIDDGLPPLTGKLLEAIGEITDYQDGFAGPARSFDGESPLGTRAARLSVASGGRWEAATDGPLGYADE